MSINLKLKLITLSFGAIILTMFLSTLYISNKQKNDGLVINLAGRQRMLTQKMTKELYLFSISSTQKDGSSKLNADKVRSTMQVFSMSLSALKNSGKAPLSLDLENTKYRYCPVAKEPAKSQLAKVENLWKRFDPVIERVLEGTNTSDDLETIRTGNIILLTEMNTAVVMMQRQAENLVGLLIKLQIGMAIIGAVFTVFAFLNITSVIRRLRKTDIFTKQLGRGDLTIKSGIDGTDELGQIGESLDVMAENLKQMIAEVRNNSGKLSDTSIELLDIAKAVSSDSEEVCDKSNSVANAADQMSSNMNSVAAAVEETSTNVAIMANSVQEITESIVHITSNTESARGMTETAVRQSKQASSRVNELGSAAHEIGKVTETITEISEQTNLLALNATIEAARAGEAGKGFAVVANEIKELAKQTAEATGDIREKIEAIQSSTSLTVTEISGISDIVNKVNEIVVSISSALDQQTATTQEISINISQASEGIQEVTENVTQSSLVASQVAQDIAGVNTDSDTINVSSTIVADNAGKLNGLAGELNMLVERFTI